MSPREAILEAAERLAIEQGLDATSMAQVCRAARMSNGSLFHFFPTKERLAGALYLRALGSYQRAVLAGLERSRSPRAAVVGLVARHVGWVASQPGLARLLLEQRHEAADREVEAEIRALNAELLHRVQAFLEPHLSAGRVRRTSPEVLLAVILGPAYALARSALRSGDPRRLRALSAELGEAAWAAMAGVRRSRS